MLRAPEPETPPSAASETTDFRSSRLGPPSEAQAGEHRILFVTLDSVDPSLRHSQEVIVRVAANLPEPTPVATPEPAPVAEPVVVATPDEPVVVANL